MKRILWNSCFLKKWGCQLPKPYKSQKEKMNSTFEISAFWGSGLLVFGCWPRRDRFGRISVQISSIIREKILRNIDWCTKGSLLLIDRHQHCIMSQTSKSQSIQSMSTTVCRLSSAKPDFVIEVEAAQVERAEKDNWLNSILVNFLLGWVKTTIIFSFQDFDNQPLPFLDTKPTFMLRHA